jgi:hypothetical protein
MADTIPSYVLHMGRAFRVLARIEGDSYVEAANDFMRQHDGAALLHADDDRKVAILADRNDVGVLVFGSGDRPRHLECCCCGGGLKGRQWHNRDDGYGLCPDCIDYCARNETVESFERCYGLRGIHFDIIGGAA